MDDIEDTLEKAVLKKVYTWLAVGAIGLGGGLATVGPSWIRSDPFTGNDSKLMEQRIELKMKLLEQEIRRDMPPLCTRKRILNIERYLEEHMDTFERSEFCW